jgi:hypothetical protein
VNILVKYWLNVPPVVSALGVAEGYTTAAEIPSVIRRMEMMRERIYLDIGYGG